LLQDLLFSVELKKFIVAQHDTGVPKLFASDIVIHQHETGEQKAIRVEVNHPASLRGINTNQSALMTAAPRSRCRRCRATARPSRFRWAV